MMLVDNEAGAMGIPQAQDEHPPVIPRGNNEQLAEKGYVSCIHRCPSVEAKKLCIHDLPQKLRHGGEYDIGGTYTGSGSDLWFYFSTSICPGYNHLLNLFICHRRTGNFSIGVSNSNELTHTERPTEKSGRSDLPSALTWYSFNSAQSNEVYYIKTFCFTEKNMKSLESNTLFIPITIIMNSTQTINHDVLKSIKLQHDLSELLTKKEKTDFTLQTASGKKISVHKIMLVAHSSVLRNLIKEAQSELFIDIPDSDMELLLQFLYTGTIKDIPNQNCLNLLKIAEKFQLDNLFLLTQYALGEQINTDSAVDIALIAQKYKLGKLQQKVFRFIKNNRKVMQTKSWKELSNVELTKQLIEHIYAGKD